MFQFFVETEASKLVQKMNTWNNQKIASITVLLAESRDPATVDNINSVHG